MKTDVNVLLVSILCATFVLVASSTSFGVDLDKAYAVNSNREEIEQIISQSNVNCDLPFACTNTVNPLQALNIVDVVNALFVNQEDVSNSAEIEQEIEQVNEDCDDFTIRSNEITAEQLLNIATVVN